MIEDDDEFYDEIDKRVSAIAIVIVVGILIIGGIIGYLIATVL